MKTPEEIKRGLECCTTSLCGCEGCPYNHNGCGDNEEMADALAYIQQLEATVVETEKVGLDIAWKLGTLEAQIPKWISVEERLPEDNERVLFFADKPMATMDTAHGLWVKTNRHYNVTHWMPLPGPPKEG